MARPGKLSTEKEIEKLQQEMMQMKKRYDEKMQYALERYAKFICKYILKYTLKYCHNKADGVY